MPEVILPCPNPKCSEGQRGYDPHCELEDFRDFTVKCRCGVSGQKCNTESAAIAAWNTLPRPLPWTYAPPKVVGWYWCSDEDDSNGYPIISYYEEWAIKEVLPKINDGKHRFKWAGPIPTPIG